MRQAKSQRRAGKTPPNPQLVNLGGKKRAEKGRRKKHMGGGGGGGGRHKEMLECLPCLASKLMIPEAGEPFSWKQQ